MVAIMPNRFYDAQEHTDGSAASAVACRMLSPAHPNATGLGAFASMTDTERRWVPTCADRQVPTGGVLRHLGSSVKYLHMYIHRYLHDIVSS